MSEFCIVCAAPQSGSTFLEGVVQAAYEATGPGEIFLDWAAQPGRDYRGAPERQVRGNFFNFRAEAFASRPELSYPDVDSRRTLFDLYLENLRSVFRTDRCLLAVDYFSWHHLDGCWRQPHDPPGLLELAREKGIPIVHLVRENIFALYCSLQVALPSGAGARESGEAGEMGTLTVSLEDCRRWLMEISTAQQHFTNWLTGHAVYNLTYESLVEDGRFRQSVSGTFTEIFGRPPIHELALSATDIHPRLSPVIANAEEVLDFFAGTEFEALVRASLLEAFVEAGHTKLTGPSNG
jgi:hypothetical protein